MLVRDGQKVVLRDFQMEKLAYEGSEEKYYGFRLGYDYKEPTFANHLQASWDQTMEFVRLVWMSLKQLVSGEAKVTDLSGPVGIVDMMAETGENAESAADAAFNIAYLGAFIAVNLAVMNMLPIPALDGGRVFFLLVTWIIESLTHKKLDPKYEGYIHGAGMVLLLGLMGFVLLNDIVKLVRGG